MILRPLYFTVIKKAFFIGLLVVLSTLSCGGSDNQERIEVRDKLSEYNLFRNIDGTTSLINSVGISSDDVSEVMSNLFDPADRVIHYDLIAPLFTDHTLKYRTIFIPEGTQINYTEDGILDFPVGTIISKTFLYVADYRMIQQNISLIETRLLIHQPDGWEAYPYYWNEDKTDADILYGGRKVEFDFLNEDGQEVNVPAYEVPAANSCATCHHSFAEGTTDEVLNPIGPEAINLNKRTFYPNDGMVNQLEHLSSLGMLSGVPDLSEIEVKLVDYTDTNLDLSLRTRSFLHVNCASCHQTDNAAGLASKLYLHINQPIDFNYGVCKMPGSAGSGGGGLRYDLVPGDADASILLNRILITGSGRMPPLSRSVVYDFGAELVRDWIDGQVPNDCSDDE